MKLRRVRISNFRSVEDTGWFTIGQKTCLVGKNESGKTAILQAIERLNSVDGSRQTYDKLLDYPRRHLSDYDSRHPGSEAVVVTSEWELEEGDRKALEDEFGQACLRSHIVEISKSYGAEQTWSIPIDHRRVLRHLMGQAGLSPSEQKEIQALEDPLSVYDFMIKRPERSNGLAALIKRFEDYPEHDLELAAVDILSHYLPHFLYFSQYSRMDGDVSIEKLRQNIAEKKLTEGDDVFLAFLSYAGTSVDEIAKTNRYEELNARCEAASNKITDQIFEYWSQNQFLRAEFEVHAGKPGDPPPFNQGNVMHARIRNELHRISVPFSERSAGFIWFFSFLVYFSQIKGNHGSVIILLDEPGLNLHGTAQRDLLRFIKEKLEPDHQVIYTTHSPFMIPADELATVRTVEDVVGVPDPKRPMRFEVDGTKVGDDVLSTDPETLFPLQGALGYEITQSLFIGEHTILVEGPSDILYLQAANAALKARGRAGLDSRWVLCPSGGLDKVSAFVSLFAGNRLHVAVLSDLARGHKGKLEQLRRSDLLHAGHVFTVADFIEQDEADIEDLFSRKLFVSLLNSAYNLPGSRKLTVDRLVNADTNTERMVKKAEAYFRLLPPGLPDFNHYEPAYWLIQNTDLLAKQTEEVTVTLDRFAEVFEAFNKLL